MISGILGFFDQHIYCLNNYVLSASSRVPSRGLCDEPKERFRGRLFKYWCQ